MKGYPQHLNTKADYMYVREHFPREQWLPDFQALLNSTHDWFFEKHLDTKEDGLNDGTHKVVENKSVELDKDGKPIEKVTYSQYELKKNPQCKLNLIGFTVDEVLKILNS